MLNTINQPNQTNTGHDLHLQYSMYILCLKKILCYSTLSTLLKWLYPAIETLGRSCFYILKVPFEQIKLNGYLKSCKQKSNTKFLKKQNIRSVIIFVYFYRRLTSKNWWKEPNNCQCLPSTNANIALAVSISILLWSLSWNRKKNSIIYKLCQALSNLTST